MSKIIVGCSGAKYIAKKIAKGIKASYGEIVLERFPDSELKIKIPDVKGKEVYFVQSFFKEFNDVNDKLIEVLFAAYTAKELGAKKINLIAPYLAYMRQDTRFHKGEAVANRILVKLFRIFDKVYAIEPHLHRLKSFKEFFPNAKKISLDVEVADFIRKKIKKDYVLVGPDMESEQWVKAIAERLKCDYVILEKKRFSSRKVRIKGKRTKNKNVIIIDDIISTGHTLIEAVKLVNAEKIYFIAMHGLFAENALKKLNKIGKVVVSDSILSKASKIGCSNAIIQSIKKGK